MRPFEYLRAEDVAGAVAAVTEHLMRCIWPAAPIWSTA
jgi:hypothetical protein